MVINVRTTLRNIRTFDELSDLIRREGKKLQEVCPQITSCKVVIDRSHQNRTNGPRFRVHVMISIPGKQLIASSESEEEYSDVLGAVSEAFSSAEDAVSSYLRRRNDIRLAARNLKPSLPHEGHILPQSTPPVFHSKQF